MSCEKLLNLSSAVSCRQSGRGLKRRIISVSSVLIAVATTTASEQ
jgi:hypothetical protein